jgi:hypothetical protein
MHPLPSEIFLVYILTKNHTPRREIAIRLFNLKLEVSRPKIIVPCCPHTK